MRIPKNLPTPRTLVYIMLLIVVLGCLPVILYARQFVQPLSVETLEQKALEAAQMLGLQGQPEVQSSIQSTLEKWYALHGDDIANTVNRHTPIFMMSMRGEVILSGDTANTYKNLIVVLDARTGQFVQYSTAYFALDTIDLAALPAPEIYVPSPIPLPPHALTARAMPDPIKPTPDRNYTPVP